MFVFDWLQDPSAWAALFTLTLLEIVLGIDNIVFISILVDRLPKEKQKLGRNVGLGLAMVSRLVLLTLITWIMSLTTGLFTVAVAPFLWKMMPSAAESGGMLVITGKDLILLVGGAFLIWKATHEIHQKLEHDEEKQAVPLASTMAAVLVQIALIDIVFSIDSVITATGMADDLSVMGLAVVISVGVMIIAAGPISSFVAKHPTVKMLALSFLILIGTALIAEGFHVEIPKGYIYVAMAFSLGVELLNLKMRSKRRLKPVEADVIAISDEVS